MDDTLLFIPPCCVGTKLPRAVMDAPHRALTFYTHGDVTMEEFYRSVSYLIGDPHVMVLAMPIVNSDVMKFLYQCFNRGWITNLILSSCRDCSRLLRNYLADYLNDILYTADSAVSSISSHLVLYSDKQALSINGPMLEMADKRPLASYTMLYHPRYEKPNNCQWGNPLLNILLPDVLRHRKAYHDQKDKIQSPSLKRYLSLNFPPYPEEDHYHDPHLIQI